MDINEFPHTVIVDIETTSIGEESTVLMPFLGSVKGGRSTNPLAQAREAEENRQKAIKKAALSPVAGQVISFAAIEISKQLQNDETIWTEKSKTHFHVIEENDKTEADVIKEFVKLIRPNTYFVTFNGRSFDFPFLMFRAAVHEIPLILPIYPYNGRDNHADLFVHLNSICGLDKLYYKWEMVGLKKWIEYFGFPVEKKSISEGQIDLTHLLREKQYGEIQEYNVGDVIATQLLWNKFKGNFQYNFRG